MELALPPEWSALLPTDRPLTADDVLQLPEGPPYFELLDGEIIVNPTPVPAHQAIVGSLYIVLRLACPADLRVFLPLDWRADERNVFEPDLVVVDRGAVGPKRLERTPLLTVEVLSPHNRSHDLVRKRQAYEAAGVASYWIVDPRGGDGPELTVLELVDGAYREVARVHGPGAVYETDRPFPVSVEPARLLD
jgi:Uma2 family endonuclease